LRNEILLGGAEGLFILRPTNLRYLSGFTGADSYGLVTEKDAFLITDSRYTEQAAKECPHFEIVRWRDPFPPLGETISALARKTGLEKIRFEPSFVSFALYREISGALGDVAFLPAEKGVDLLRYVKDEEERTRIAKAADIADRAFATLLSKVVPGTTERDLARDLAYEMELLGAEGKAFDIIVASGENGSMPHAIPGRRRLKRGDFVTFDFGALYDGYRSDMTRTVVLGKATPRQKELYNLVLEAQQAGIAAIKAGVPGREVDAAARSVIVSAGLGDAFSHGLGHGVGLDIHEEPFMSARCTKILEKGCVVTVEPGVYLKGWGGVRIEDSVAVESEGVIILTRTPKELLELA
jgi:Xaa-Pro aminopeptidase